MLLSIIDKEFEIIDLYRFLLILMIFLTTLFIHNFILEFRMSKDIINILLHSHEKPLVEIAIHKYHKEGKIIDTYW